MKNVVSCLLTHASKNAIKFNPTSTRRRPKKRTREDCRFYSRHRALLLDRLFLLNAVPLSKESLVANTLHPAPFRMALLDATTANDDSIVVAFSDDDDDDDESMILTTVYFVVVVVYFQSNDAFAFAHHHHHHHECREDEKWNGEGESAVPSFDMRARVFGAQRRQRDVIANEEKTTKIFFLRKKKGKDEMRERHHLYKVTFVCVLK